MSNAHDLVDGAERLMAETTFDRNVVVVAGAGTGKTTLLVNRILHALVREPHPVRLIHLVALTFTNKAAHEMKMRLRECLRLLLSECEGGRRDGVFSHPSLTTFQQAYHLSSDVIRQRILVALEDLDKSHIRTLHSFAASVLRLYPLEAGVNPTFQEDEGDRFDAIFHEVWDRWLEYELGSQGSSHKSWEQVLQAMTLSEVRDFARAIGEADCSGLEWQGVVGEFHRMPAFVTWVRDKYEQADRLLETYRAAKPRKIERNLAVAHRVFSRTKTNGLPVDWGDEEHGQPVFDPALGAAPVDWNLVDFQTAKRVIQSAQHLLKVHHPLLEQVMPLLVPCIQAVRQRYEDEGWVGFDGLLLKVRNLLRDVPLVREQLKRDCQAILVDEFQDTDPLQYEILLYLAEQPGEHSRSWREVRLVPGKLFIVGDPKQSIYAFRKADLEAFDQVVKKLVEDGANLCTLVTNFRSTEAVLRPINAVFEQLFVAKENVQPPHVALVPARRSERESGAGVELYVLRPREEAGEWDAERAARAEAEWLGDWIHEQLRGDGMRPGHMAVLFRKLTNAQWYVEALRRRGIPYITDGERHFYRRQEVIDFVNILRIIDDPADRIALIGILRSPLGGVPDQEIMNLAQSDFLDVLTPPKLAEWKSPQREVVLKLYEQLAALHRMKGRLPVSEFMNLVLGSLPVLELAAASGHGEQAVVNVGKVRDIACRLGKNPSLSFSDVVDQLAGFLRDQPQETEAPLAEDSLDAVRVLTIHKAKGLEFPLVILPGLHLRAGGPLSSASLTRDWVSGLLGATFSRWCSAGQVPIWEKQRNQEEMEQRRILYVGMTRAKERLVLSGGLMGKSGGGTPFHLLRGLAGDDFGNEQCVSVGIGPVKITQTVVIPEWRSSRVPQEQTISMAVPKRDVPSLTVWESRSVRWTKAQHTKAWVVPSFRQQPYTQSKSFDHATAGHGPAFGARLGNLLHRLLEQCDFSQDATVFHQRIEAFCRSQEAMRMYEDAQTLFEEVRSILRAFPESDIFQELSRSRILGREVAVAMPWNLGVKDIGLPENGVMEGVMDVVYTLEGEYWVGDYKTDAVEGPQLLERADRYRVQAERYAHAAACGLGVDVKGCKLFFIRSGKTVIVPRVQSHGL